MTYAEFEALAEREWDRIPDAFKAGVDAFVIRRDAKAHDRSPDVYTLGECVTEAWPSDYGGPDTIRSELILYYGSFRRLAAMDREFDWETEVWETLTHELKHHLESLADEDDLEDLDAAMEQHFRRHDGEPFDPFYFRGGDSLGGGWYRLEDAFFLEVADPPDGSIAFEWKGQRYRLGSAGDRPADVSFLTVENIDDPPDELVVVAITKRSLGARLRSLLRREAIAVAERTVRADRETKEVR